MNIKRLFDVIVSVFALTGFAPILLIFMYLIWRQDGHSPLYSAPRVGIDGKIFTMIKLRSMVINADQTGVDSTGSSDPRITSLGSTIRRFKLDEITQLWNVLVGDMSLVGPRPNVKRETDLYTAEERRLLSVKPGITDFASIVFADEGDILRDKHDPDLAYHQLIRPAKSELGLFYIENRSFLLDFALVGLTAFAIFSRTKTLLILSFILERLGCSEQLREVSLRQTTLIPRPPPGAYEIVTSRDGKIETGIKSGTV